MAAPTSPRPASACLLGCRPCHTTCQVAIAPTSASCCPNHNAPSRPRHAAVKCRLITSLSPLSCLHLVCSCPCPTMFSHAYHTWMPCLSCRCQCLLVSCPVCLCQKPCREGKGEKEEIKAGEGCCKGGMGITVENGMERRRREEREETDGEE